MGGQNRPRWLGHGGESIRPYPASVLAFLAFKVSRVVCHRRGRVCERRDSLRACWFLYVIRWCGPDAAAGSGFLERWSDPNLSPLLLNGLIRLEVLTLGFCSSQRNGKGYNFQNHSH
ncbi:hypothetical protein J1605_001860 [Eschrichtius robustus]|uniref:Uncharacterized protein n=1 Tax=Eschrichtius robustus TaxID=9764 RepID=A0AB34I0T6_ESCRO|nr:hypothetical protein J1605_001860 [Eschrichtius robustus]